MGMSTHVTGFKPADEKWHRMKAIADACDIAGVSWPPEVADFFGDELPDPSGVAVEIQRLPCCREWSDDCESGFEIDVSKLPADVKIVRFYNSW